MSFTCRIMREEDFNEELELFIMKSSFQYEPTDQGLDSKTFPQIDRFWLKKLLEKAKDDQISVGIYPSTEDDQLPIGYAINHSERRNYHEDSRRFSFSAENSSLKEKTLSQRVGKSPDETNLFDEFQSNKNFYVCLLEVDPIYRRRRFSSLLLEFSLGLAKKNEFDLIYADSTRNYSFDSFLQHKFEEKEMFDRRFSFLVKNLRK